VSAYLVAVWGVLCADNECCSRGGGGSGSVHVVKSALASSQSGPEPRCFTSELRSCAKYSEQTVTRRAFRL